MVPAAFVGTAASRLASPV